MRMLLMTVEERWRQEVVHRLSGSSPEILLVTKADEAWYVLHREHIDLIVVDLLFEHVNVFEFIKLVRNTDRCRHVPLLVFSAVYLPGQATALLQAGATYFKYNTVNGKDLADAIMEPGEYHLGQLPATLADADQLVRFMENLQRSVSARAYELEAELRSVRLTMKEGSDELETINEELNASIDQLSEKNDQLVMLNDKLMKAAEIIQEQSETILKQKDEQLNRVLDSSHDVIWSFDLTGNGENYLSRSATHVYGKPYELLLNEPFFWTKYVHPEDVEKKGESEGRLRSKGESECTYRIVTPSGTRWVRDWLRLIRDDAGKESRIEGIATDVTSFIESEAKMAGYRKNLEIIFENSTNTFILLDRKGSVILYNKVYENYVRQLAGIVPSYGMNFIDTVAPARREVVKKILFDVMAGKTVNTISETIWPNGIRYYDVIYTPVVVDDAVTYITVTSADVTEKKIQEDHLKKSRENLEIIFKNSSDYFALFDREGRFYLFNENFEKIVFEYYQGKLQEGICWWDLIPPDRQKLHKEFFNRALQGEIFYVDIQAPAESGTRYFETRYAPYFLNNEVTYVSVSAIDITERRKMENMHKRDQLFLEKATEHSDVAYWTAEPDLVNGKIVWSKGLFEIFGTSVKGIDGRIQSFLEAVDERDRKQVVTAFQKAIELGQPLAIDHRLSGSHRPVKWVSERANLVSDGPDGRKLLVGITQDITDRKLTEQVLREYNDRFEIVSRATNDAIWDWDIVLDTVQWNHGIESIFGYAENEVKNSTQWAGKIHPEDYDRVHEEINLAFEHSLTNQVFEYRYTCADGTYKHVLDRAYVVYNDKAPVRMIGAMQDVSEITEYRINLEQLVEERTQKLNMALLKEKELVDLKSRFISIASHEFRTPLTTIRLAASFLKRYKNKLDAKMLEERANIIEKEVGHMTSLVDDVLFVGKIEDGKIKPALREYTFEIFGQLVSEAMKTTDEHHRVDLQVNSLSKTFRSDEKLLRNIVFNLITNAVKFSPEAKQVIMRVDQTSDQILLRVRDQGIGIPKNELKNLFTSFSRASNASSIEGSGLGLLIIKKAVDLLGGTVNVWSELGEGTEFTIRLPVA